VDDRVLPMQKIKNSSEETHIRLAHVTSGWMEVSMGKEYHNKIINGTQKKTKIGGIPKK